MQTLLIIFSITIVVLSISYFITISVKYDLLNNSGKLMFYLFKIPIFWLNFTFIGEYLNFTNRKNKVIKIKIDFNDDKLIFFKDVSSNLFKKIYINKIDLNMVVGLENPVISSLLCAEINMIISCLYSYFSTKFKDINLLKNINVGYRHNCIVFDFKISLMVSIYDYLWAYLKAYKQYRRRMYEKGHSI